MNNKPIRICFIIDVLEVGGTEKQLLEVIRSLSCDKFKLYLVCFRNSTLLRELGTYCTRLVLNIKGLTFINFMKSVVVLKSFLKKERIDIVQTFFIDANILGVTAGKLAGVRKIISSRRDMGFWYNTKILIYLKLINIFVDRFLVNSEAIKRNVAKIEKIPGNKIDVIYNGINLNKFRNDRNGNVKEIRTEMKIPSNNIVVGLVSNLNRQVKRPDVFIKASALVKKRIKNINFLIIGDGYLRKELIELSKDLNVYNETIFTGQQKDINRLLKIIDIGVLTSDSEGFSNSILEYMANGIPVVATDVGGNREMIRQKIDGYLAPPGQPEAIAELILDLAINGKLRKAFGENAKERIEKKFSVENMMKNMEEYYSRLSLN